MFMVVVWAASLESCFKYETRCLIWKQLTILYIGQTIGDLSVHSNGFTLKPLRGLEDLMLNRTCKTNSLLIDFVDARV